MRRALALVGATALLVSPLGPASADQKKDVVVVVQDPAIIESSGLVVRDGNFLTTNDSGDEGRVFIIDGKTGKTLGTTFWSDSPEDVEGMAPAEGDDVWLGDIGDNNQKREWIEVTKVAVRPGEQVQAGQTFRLMYPEDIGPQNAEALLRNPVTDRLYIATKVILGGRLYEAPQKLDPVNIDNNVLKPIAKVGNFLTDGAFFPDGKHLILRGYGRATVYSFPDMTQVGEPIDLPEQPQGEGIAVADDYQVYVSSEGKNQPILRVTLPPGIASAVAPTDSASPSASSGSSSSPDATGSADASDSASGGSGKLALAGGGLIALVALAGGGMYLYRRKG